MLNLWQRYANVRSRTREITSVLLPEDFSLQCMDDVSPPKWHLAHTSWFYERFVLRHFVDSYRPFHEDFEYLFNSYYESVGSFHPRSQRGLLSRPAIDTIRNYIDAVDNAIHDFLSTGDATEEARNLIELGTHHEQQHQELLLTDIKYNFFCNPLKPAYRHHPDNLDATKWPHSDRQSFSIAEGLYPIGFSGTGFHYDNETGRHKVFQPARDIDHRLITNGEFLEFMQDGGYGDARHWLSDGWHHVKRQSWQAPLYWLKRDDMWWHYTLDGLRKINLNQPVCHVSYFEADAFSRWSGRILPSEFEWEIAATDSEIAGNLLECNHLHPVQLAPGHSSETAPSQLFGDVWEWTRSPYSAYPGFKCQDGAVGEYNGKFMCNQYVLRGGSCLTPTQHIRSTYRNFFPPQSRWQFSGFRTAKE